MKWLYNISIWLYGNGLLIASVFNPKAALWIRGRKNWKSEIKKQFVDNTKTVAWFHCASLGEFEQGRPLLEAYTEKYPQHRILLTFFSPSGFEVRKNYSGAHSIIYLPLDLPSNVRFFLDTVKPAIAIFIKYEFWLNFIHGLSDRNIPLLVVSSNFRPQQHFFKWYGGFFRKGLKKVNQFFVQTQTSADLLKNIGIQAIVSGDTRFDRVLQISKNKQRFPLVEKFCAGNKILIGGSTWPKEEEMLYQFYQNKSKDTKLIIAPHETHEGHIQQIQQLFGEKTVLFTELDTTDFSDKDVLIINTIGKLSHLYQYAHLALIGGGFGVGTHNILEAVNFGLPVIFGPNHRYFYETKALAAEGGAFPISGTEDFLHITSDILYNDEKLLHLKKICLEFIQKHCGATAIVMGEIEKTNSLKA
jgi:3-deoxy-D-manno-octulosonic-acid transferase